jgi:hypothetical protein
VLVALAPRTSLYNLRQTISWLCNHSGFLTYNEQVREILLSTDSDIHCLIISKLVVAAFNLAALVSDHKNEEHQVMRLFWLSPVSCSHMGGYRVLIMVQSTRKGTCSKLQ